MRGDGGVYIGIEDASSSQRLWIFERYRSRMEPHNAMWIRVEMEQAWTAS